MEYSPTSEEIEALGLGPLKHDMVRFCCAFVPRLRALDPATRHRALLQASEHSLREPLQYHYKSDLRVPDFDPKRRFNGEEIIALMAVGTFVHVGEDSEGGAALVEMFPEVLAASLLATAHVEREQAARRSEERRRDDESLPLFAGLQEDKAA